MGKLLETLGVAIDAPPQTKMALKGEDASAAARRAAEQAESARREQEQSDAAQMEANKIAAVHVERSDPTQRQNEAGPRMNLRMSLTLGSPEAAR